MKYLLDTNVCEDMTKKWGKIRLKRACKINKITIGEDTAPDWEMQYLDISAVDSEGNVGTLETHTFANAPSRARRRVSVGDTVISTVRTYLKAIAHFEQPPENLIASTGFAVLSPNKEFDSRFLWRAAQDHDFIDQVVANSEGVGYPAIAPSCLANLPISFPPLNEQRRIAAYLDQQTAKIDRLIDLRRRQIALLKEQRAALIQQAVTRGLNPNVPMKDSGLPWLGQVPAHWEIKRLKWLATLQRGYDLPDQDRVEGDIPVVTSGGIVANHNQAMAKAPGVVTGRYGSTGNVFYIDSDFWPHNTALYVNDFHDNIPRFVYYVMQTINYEIHSAKSAVPGVDRKDLHETFVVVPPRSEQDEIVDFIESKNEKFNALNSAYSRQLTLLAEYRAALIHECVTGRRPVPDHFDPGVYEND